MAKKRRRKSTRAKPVKVVVIRAKSRGKLQVLKTFGRRKRR